MLTCNGTGKTSGKTRWISKLHNFRTARPRPVKVSRYLLKSYVGSAKCRAVETFGVILHPYKDKECSKQEREDVVLFQLFDFVWCCGNVAKIKFMNQRLTFLEAYYYEIKVRTKTQLHNNTQHAIFIITGSTPVGYEGELQLSQFDLQETYFRYYLTGAYLCSSPKEIFSI